MAMPPVNERVAAELRAVVGAQYLRQATLCEQLFKDPDQPCRGDRSTDLDAQDLAIEVIDDV